MCNLDFITDRKSLTVGNKTVRPDMRGVGRVIRHPISIMKMQENRQRISLFNM
jgi:hypothetical protein